MFCQSCSPGEIDCRFCAAAFYSRSLPTFPVEIARSSRGHSSRVKAAFRDPASILFWTVPLRARARAVERTRVRDN